MKTHFSSAFGNNLVDKSQQFQLETQYGHTIQLLVNQHTQQPIVALKNKRGQIISQAQLDIQLNTKRLQSVELEQVAYDSETKNLIFIFADESTVQTSIQALWDELEQTVIGQLVLLKNILARQHEGLANLLTTQSQSLRTQVVTSNESSTTLIKEDLASRATSIAETLALLAGNQSRNRQDTLSALSQNTQQLLSKLQKLTTLETQLAAVKVQEGQHAQSLTSTLSDISQAIGAINEQLSAAATKRTELNSLITNKSGDILSSTSAISQTVSNLTNKIGSVRDVASADTLFGKIASLRSQLTNSQSDLAESLIGELAEACTSLEQYLSTQVLSPIQGDLQTASSARADALQDLQTRLAALSASVGSVANAETAASGLYKQLAAVAEQITAFAESTSDAEALQRIEGALDLAATAQNLEDVQAAILGAIGDFSSLDQKTLVALLTAILAQVEEKSTDELSSELADKLGFEGEEDNVKVAIQAAVNSICGESQSSETLATIKGAIEAIIAKLGLPENSQDSIAARLGTPSGEEEEAATGLYKAVSDIEARISNKIGGLTNNTTLASLLTTINSKLGFEGGTDTAKAAITAAVGKLGLDGTQTVSGLLSDIRGDTTTTLSQINTAITTLASGTTLSGLATTINNNTNTMSATLAGGMATTLDSKLAGAVASIQGGSQGQTKQTLASINANISTVGASVSSFDTRLEFVVTLLANKPTLKIVGNSISVPTYYLVGSSTTIPVRAQTSRTLKADELLNVSLETVSGTLDGAKGSTNTKTPDDKSYTTTTDDTTNLTITATLTKTNPYDASQNFVIATASKTVYRAYKVYYGYAAGTEEDPAPNSIEGLTGKDVYSTYGTCDIPAKSNIGDKYLYIFVPNGFGTIAGELQISSNGFVYDWKSATSSITGYYMYKSAELLKQHGKISLIQ